MILDKIDELLKEVQELSARNAEEVEQLRLKYLSKKGEITALMNDFRNVAADQKKTVGMKINELKTLATEPSTSCVKNVRHRRLETSRWT